MQIGSLFWQKHSFGLVTHYFVFLQGDVIVVGGWYVLLDLFFPFHWETSYSVSNCCYHPTCNIFTYSHQKWDIICVKWSDLSSYVVALMLFCLIWLTSSYLDSFFAHATWTSIFAHDLLLAIFFLIPTRKET